MKPTQLPQIRPVKMATLARLSGVPAATIKHYLREGLLPQPEVKTSRNMALYDPALVERIQRIKKLQREQFLPLRVIKSVLDGQPSPEDDADAAAAIQRALDTMAPQEVRTRGELIASGASAEDLTLFESLGLLSPVKVGSQDAFTGDDLSLLRVLGASRRAGITREMLPPDIIGPYVAAISELVRVELAMFRKGVIPRAGQDLAQITDAATRLSEQLVVIIRRRMLLPMLGALVSEHTEAREAKAATRASTRPEAKRRGTPRTRKKEQS